MIQHYAGQSNEIAELFYRSIHEIACSAYSEDQLNAWAPYPIDYDRWKYRCELKRPFLYVIEEQIAGFIELDPDGHIDCHYVHPNFTRRGVATALLNHVMEIALQLEFDRLFVEASHVIRPLYEKQGFTVVKANQVERHGIVLENWIMELPRNPKS
ncbi:GNAT family N-acetyltransferase [Rubinisphaera italica]|uniref:Putative N-acetyltransferase YafP n=1 Tax=Rubinisphaera italica TaxID=2527969 RepID=A0A5C5XJI3_9PLAN|nr:GNAT family N-acetyltransferase [Rubinisphaera italica]TWT62531.1 putative N-acetyltransferase YafP [Rubinisphaera italica]